MNKKFVLAGVISGVAAFFLGWLIWGILLMKFSEANTTVYPGLVKEDMNFIAILLSNLVWGFTLTWIYANFSGKKSIKGGAITGLTAGLLLASMLNLAYMAFWNLYTTTFMVVDVIANGVYSAILGAIIGAILRKKE
jgi:hypothetical protein